MGRLETKETKKNEGIDLTDKAVRESVFGADQEWMGETETKEQGFQYDDNDILHEYFDDNPYSTLSYNELFLLNKKNNLEITFMLTEKDINRIGIENIPESILEKLRALHERVSQNVSTHELDDISKQLEQIQESISSIEKNTYSQNAKKL